MNIVTYLNTMNSTLLKNIDLNNKNNKNNNNNKSNNYINILIIKK